MVGPQKQKLNINIASEILFTALYLGLTSFGGPIAHLGYFHTVYVKNKQWLEEELYHELVSLCQFLPGPASTQLGIAIGIYRGGILGGFLAWLGFTVPSAIFLYLAFYGLHELPSEQLLWIHGLKIVAVAVVAQALWSMSLKLTPDRPRILIAIFGAILILLWPNAYMQLILIITAALGGIFFKKTPPAVLQNKPAHSPINRQTGAFALFLFFLLLFGLPLLRELFDNQPLAVFDSFYRTGALVFGGGHVVLPMLEKEVIPVGWVDQNQFLTGYGLTQAVPGPLFTFATYLGTAIAGWKGALLTTIAIFLPSFLFVIGILPFWNALRAEPALQSVLWSVNAIVVGILFAALYTPIWTSSIQHTFDFVIVIICFTMLQILKMPAWTVVICACGLSILQ